MNKIVQLTQDNVAVLLQWAESEGWNPGVDDAQAFFNADPRGYLGVVVGKEMVAAISVVRQSASFAFLGLYMCKPAFRGKGYGWAVWQAGMDRLQGCTVGLDGVVEQQGNYAKSGFTVAWRNQRFSGLVDSSLANHGIELRDFDQADFETVVAYDQSIGGVERRDFLTPWLSGTDTRKTLLAIMDSSLVGVVTIRQCVEGFKIGPLLADNTVIAEALLVAAAKKMSTGQVIVDVPDTNVVAIGLVESLGLRPVFETARMYRGVKPAFDHSRLFGITTLELG